MYFQNNQQWDQSSRGPITAPTMQLQAAPQGPDIFGTLLGLIGSGMNFASGNIMGGLQGLNGALGGQTQAPPPQATPVDVNQDSSSAPKNPEVAEKKDESIKDKQPEPTQIETAPIPSTVFDPTGLGAGQQNLILQLLMSGLLGGPNQAPQQPQVPYSSQTNFQRGF